MPYNESIILPDGSERKKETIFNEIVDAASEQDLKAALNDEVIAVTIDDFNEGSQNYFVSDAVAEVIYQLEDFLNEIDKGTRISMTEDVMIREKGLEKGLFPYDGEYATGEVTFSLPLPANSDTEISEGTTIATDSVVSYETLEELVIPAGIISGIVPVKSDIAGSEGNIPAKAITTVLSDIPQTVTVTNENPITGGIDPESDNAFRQRLIDSNSPPGTKGFYEFVLKTTFEDAFVRIDEDEKIQCWLKPFKNQANPIQTARELFEKDEYTTTDDIIINDLKPVEAFTAGTRKLYIKYQADGTVSTQDLYNEIMKKLDIYVNKQKMNKGTITLHCIKFLVESTMGVQYFDTIASSYKGYNNGEHHLQEGEYFVFNNKSMITIEEIK